ncbi:MAG: hypothetical protein GY708_09370 [Actinomycetia bacterium]|nr:hypothetical protein [Actinomycetes bacterium]
MKKRALLGLLSALVIVAMTATSSPASDQEASHAHGDDDAHSHGPDSDHSHAGDEDHGHSHPEGEELSAEEDLQLHLETIVASNEEITTMAQARQSMEEHRRFSELMGKLVDSGIHDILGAAVYNGLGEPPTLRFTRRDERTEQILADAGFELDVSFDAPRSRDELDEITDRVVAEMRDRAGVGRGQGQVPAFFVAAEEQFDRIVVVVEQADPDGPNRPGKPFVDRAEVNSVTAAAVALSGPPIAIDFSTAPRETLVDGEETTYGGLQLETYNGTTAACTTGFRVKKGSTVGYLTAGHCNFGSGGGTPGITEMRHWWGTVHTIGDPTVAGTRYVGYWGDWQMIAPNQTADGRVYVHNTTVRAFVGYKSRNQMYIGEEVCVMGRATNYQRCADIEHRTASNGNVSRLMRMDADISQQGDSGAPWFYWTTAYGVHHGKSNGNSAFTPVGTPLWYSNLTFYP